MQYTRNWSFVNDCKIFFFCGSIGIVIWCDFDRASSLICRNKMPTRCSRGFYCRSYCMLNMFRAPLCPSSGVQEYYTVVAACGISSCWSGVELRVMCSVCRMLQQLENHSTKYHRQQPLYNTLELLMMGIVVPETCWASNKICIKNLCCIELAFYFRIYRNSNRLCYRV